jgi:hypothetical protein
VFVRDEEKATFTKWKRTIGSGMSIVVSDSIAVMGCQ